MKVATLLAVTLIAIGCDSSSEQGSGFNGVGGNAGGSVVAGAGGASGAAGVGGASGAGVGGAGGAAGVVSMTSGGAGGAGGMSSTAGTGGASGIAGMSAMMAGAGGTAGIDTGGTGGVGAGGEAGGGAALTCPEGCTEMVSACFCPPMVVDWNGAQTICMNAGLGLATIRDQASNDAIASVIAAQGLSGQDSSLYIGLEDHATEGTFGWVSGEPLEFTNWAPEQPNNSFIQAGPEGEDCGVIQADGGWWDFPCNLLTAGFICN